MRRTIVSVPLELVDSYGRVARDLRVSFADRCNLRCTYCMPAEGLEWIPTERSLDNAEVIRLVTLAVEKLGVRFVRFTGGEPLLRRSLENIVAATARLRTDHGRAPATAITTDALDLDKRAAELAAADLDRINVSLDSADRTGVEMEALTAVSVAALSVIDMVKGVDRSAYIRRMGITAKSGGRSGDWTRELP